MAYRELGAIEIHEVLRRFCLGKGLRAIARGTGFALELTRAPTRLLRRCRYRHERPVEADDCRGREAETPGTVSRARFDSDTRTVGAAW
jgi:hypothetical protein